MPSENYGRPSVRGSTCPGITNEAKTRSKLFGLWGLSLAQNFEVDLAVLVILFWEPYLYLCLPEGADTHSKTPTKSWTKSGTKSGATSGTQGYQVLWKRILKAYQAIYFLMTEDPDTNHWNHSKQYTYFLRREDPEIIPGNRLAQYRGSWSHTRHDCMSGTLNYANLR